MESVRNLTQAYSQTPWRKQLKLIVLFLLCVVFIALVAGIYLDVTARASTMGREILTMRADIDKAKLDIADLETNLAQIVSATEMKERALDLGFEPVEQDQVMYVVVPGYVGRQQPVLAPPPVPVQVVSASLPVDYKQSLFEWFDEYLLPEVRGLMEVRP